MLLARRADAAVGTGYALGTIMFGGNYNTTPSYAYSASISGVSDGAFTSATNTPTALVFYTGVAASNGTTVTGTADAVNKAAGTERMRISSAGTVTIPGSLSIPNATRADIAYSTGQVLNIAATTNNPNLTTSDLINPRLAPMIKIKEDVGSAEVNSPTAVWIHLNSAGGVAAGGSGQEMVGLTSMVRSQATSGQHRPLWGANFWVGVQGDAADSTDTCGVETDMFNGVRHSGTDYSLPGYSYGMWAQGDGPFLNGAGFIVTNNNPENIYPNGGWRHGFFAKSKITEWIAYLETEHVPTGTGSSGGIYVKVPTPADSPDYHDLLKMLVGTNEKFRIDCTVSTGGGVESGVWIHVNGGLREIMVGAADSAGAGYRVMRVVN